MTASGFALSEKRAWFCAPAIGQPGRAGHLIGFAPGVPHFANLPFAALQRVVAGAVFSGHLMNFPLASRHGAANAGVASRAAAVSAAAKIFMSNLSIGAAAPVSFAS